jgi:hypothetical protein
MYAWWRGSPGSGQTTWTLVDCAVIVGYPVLDSRVEGPRDQDLMAQFIYWFDSGRIYGIEGSTSTHLFNQEMVFFPKD